MLSENASPSIIAVISGDVVKSTALSAVEYEQMLAILQTSLAEVCAPHADNQYEISRGDAFQVIVHDPENAPYYSLLIRSALKSCQPELDCRISIGIATDYHLRQHIGQSTGAPFILSGKALDKMVSERLVINSNDERLNQQLALSSRYLDYHLSTLSDRQVAILQLLLQHQFTITHLKIAKQLAAPRTSITRSINSARLDLVEEYVHYSRAVITEFCQ